MAQIIGTTGSDELAGTSGDDVIAGLDGGDYIYATPGHDAIDGGGGNDSLYAYFGGAMIFAPVTNAQTYTITANHLSDSSGQLDTNFANVEYISIASGNNYNNTFDASGFAGASGVSLTGGDGNDRMTGSAGNDYLNPGTGVDVVDGGAGIDTAYLYFAGLAGSVALDNSTPAVLASITVGGVAAGSIINVEQVNFTGGSGGDTVIGGASDDFLSGGGGNDSLHGGGGYDALTGGDGSDLLDGGAGTDTVNYSDAVSGVTVDLNLQGAAQNTGGSGTDTLISIENINGSFYSDTLTGDSNNNFLSDFYGGNDQFFGNDGSDNLQISRYGTGVATTVTLSGGGDGDTLTFYGDNRYSDTATLDGGSGGDSISAIGLGSGTILAGSGDDGITIDTLGGQYTITLGAGSDALYLASTSGGFRAAAAITVTDFTTGNGGDVLYLSGWLSGGALTNQTAGANPFLDGHLRLLQSGTSTLLQANRDGGGDGYVTLVTFQSTTATAFTATNLGGYSQNDEVNIVTGTSGNDFISGSLGKDNISGGDGSDTINLSPGHDVIDGGAGYDSLYANLYNPIFTPAIAARTYTITTAHISDSSGLIDTSFTNIEYVSLSDYSSYDNTFDAGGFIGSNGISLSGGSGNDRLIGSAGNDYLSPGSGANIVDGGAGSDTASLNFFSQTAGISLDNSNPAAVNSITIGGIAAGSITNIENLYYYGGSGADTITGGASYDSLSGGAGDDVLHGGGGSDSLSGGAGADLLDGGAGTDSASYYDASSGISVDLNLQGTAQNTGGSGSDTLISIENLYGSSYSDSLTGDANANAIGDSSGGNDQFFGNGGADDLSISRYGTAAATTVVLSGGADADTLNFYGDTRYSDTATLDGGDGADFITALGLGNGTIVAGSGNDQVTIDTLGGQYTITLGAGSDTLTLAGTNGAFRAAAAITITDFTAGSGGDVLSLGNWLSGGALTNLTAGTNPFLDGHLQLIQSGTSTLLQADRDGGGDAYATLVTFQNTTATALTAVNLGGLAPTSSGLIGTAGADTLTGSAANDTINGLDGNDLLIAGGGTDVLHGGNGDDILLINDRPNSGLFDGGAGTDTLRIQPFDVPTNNGFGPVSDPIFIGSTLSSIERLDLASTSGQRIQAIFLLSQASALAGTEVSGGAGPDSLVFIVTSGGDYSMPNLTRTNWSTDLTPVTDATTVLNTDVFLLAAVGSGNYTLRASASHPGLEGLSGNTGDDILIGGGGSDNLNGGNGGADQLFGFGGTDFLNVAAGTDNADDLFDGGDGIDYLSVSGAVNFQGALVSVEGISLLAPVTMPNGLPFNTAADLTLSADTAKLFGANALLRGTGHVGITLTHADTLNLSGWTFETAPITVSMVGSSGDDTLIGTSHDDQISGNDGNDILRGGAGNDMLDGGTGIDTASYADTSAAVTVSLALATAQNTQSAGVDTLTGIENLTGSAFNDTLTGDGGDNVIDGGAGNDIIGGGSGNDTLTGGSGNDTLQGGAGIDTASYADAIAGVKVSLSITTAQDTLAAGVDTLTGIENLTGSAFNDNLLGNADANILTGGAGDDGMLGNGGNDMMLGGDGKDTLFAGDGDDTLFGGADDDYLNGNAGDDTVFGDAGNDLLRGEAGADKLDGGAGNDGLVGGDADDILTGGLGNDVLDGSAGIDTASYSDSGSGVVVSLAITSAQNTIGAGSDTLLNIENLQGSGFNDTLTGDAGSNVLSGGAGNDSLIGGAGDDRLDGGDGLDTASYASDAGVTVSLAITGAQATGGAGTDTLIGIENLSGSAQNDILTGDAGANVIQGNAGNDIISGGLGDDILDGGSNTDTVTYADAGAAVTVTLGLIGGQQTGGAGVDQLISFENLTGSAFNDTLSGDAGANTIDGAAGNDVIGGGAGNDRLIGGSGIDTASYADAGAAVTVSLALTSGQNTGGAGIDTLSGFENLTGSLFADTLTGDAGANTINGGAGDDLISGGLGSDTLEGGTGVDTVTYADATSAVLVSLAITTAQNTNGGGTDTLSGFENLTGSAFNDTLTGDASANVILGGAGNDTIMGGLGDDMLDGGAGTDTASYADAASSVTVSLANTAAQQTLGAGIDTLTSFERLTGSAFNDTLTGDGANNIIDGGAGDDLINGGLGNDSLIGGIGNDTVSYADAASAVVASLAVTSAQNTGAAGTDTLSGIENLSGSAFDDRLSGDAGANRLSGLGGNDVLSGGLGDDIYDGGAGSDTASYADAASAVHVSLAIVGQQATGAGNDQLIAIENLTGSNFADDLTGDSGANILQGGAGNDTIAGADGNDVISGGTGDDTLSGGNGMDTASYDDAATGVTVSLALSGGQNTIGAGTDTLAGFESLAGSAFDDILTGSATANTLSGGAGNDVLNGGLGDDTLDGGAGSDTASYADATAAVRVSLAVATAQQTVAAGKDVLISIENLNGSAFGDIFTGNAGANIMRGGAGNDTIDAGDGDDILVGGSGNDLLTGGAGIDTASYDDATGGVTVSLAILVKQATLGAGNDTLSGFENLTGSDHNDILTGDTGANILVGGIGDDILSGGLGDDILNGGAGKDTVNYSDAATSVRVTLASVVQNNTAAGRDQLIGIENIIGTSFGDNLSGDGGANIIWGGAGNDTINGNDGDDILVGGAGNDILTGGNGIDTASYDDATAAVTVSLALGTVQATVGAGNDTLVDIENLTGSAFNDILTGNAGANAIHGGGGNDIISGGGGNDLLDGGIGADTLSYADAAAGVSVSLAILTAQDTIGAGVDIVSGFENLLGSAFADHLYGDGLANRIDGGAGDDMIMAGGGDDFVIGGLGNDTMDGGTGNDTLSYEDSVAAVMISLGMAGPQDSGGAGVDSLTGFENLIGSKFADTLTGDGVSNLIRGGVGNDIINGGAGADQLFGESGVDIVNGGAGQDVLTGGGSGDRFIFSTAADSAVGFDDTITDFHHAEKDRIDLSGVYGGTFSFIGSGGFTGHAGQLGFSAYDSGILVAGDIDGDGHADFEIKLIGAAAIEAADFFL